VPFRNTLIFAAAALAFVVGPLAYGAAGAAEDWPRWRGPRGDGISTEAGLVDRLPDAPKRLWEVEVGVGYASPVAHKGKVYAFGLVNNQDTLTALDAKSGKVLWSQSYAGGKTNDYPGARCTPAIDGERIYTYGAESDLAARNLADGKLVWRVNVLKETNGQNKQWAISSTPLIVGDAIYVQGGIGGAAAVAINKNTGRGLWASQAKDGGYAHPILVDVGGAKLLICFANKSVLALNPTTGQTVWEVPWETQYDVNAATPIYRDGHLFITSDYGRGCMMLKLTARTAQKVWENKVVTGRFQAGILDGTYLYANSEGTLKCLSWPDGKVQWEAGQRENLLGNGGSIVRVDKDKLVMMSERGKLSLARATPQAFTALGSANGFFDGQDIWATPLVYDGKLYAKGKTQLVCIDLKAP